MNTCISQHRVCDLRVTGETEKIQEGESNQLTQNGTQAAPANISYPAAFGDEWKRPAARLCASTSLRVTTASIFLFFVALFACGTCSHAFLTPPEIPKNATTINLVYVDILACQILRNLSAYWPGGRANVACVPLTEWYTRVFATLRARSPIYDVVVMDSQWLGSAVEANGGQPYLEELTTLVNSSAVVKSDFADGVLTAFGQYPPTSGRYWGLPLNGNVHLFLYRRSIFQRLNILTPTTLLELLQAARLINASRVIPYALSSFYCVNSTNCFGDELPSFYNELAWMFGGDIWDPATYRIKGVLDSTPNANALRYMRNLFLLTSQRTDMGFVQILNEICTNKSAMAMSWFSSIGSLESFRASCPLSDDIGFFAVPQNSMTDLHILQLGGQGVYVNAASKHKALAKDFVAFITSQDVQKVFSSLGGYSVRKSVLSDVDLVVSLSGECLSHRVIYLQSFPITQDYWNLPEYIELLAIQTAGLFSAIINASTPEAALAWIASQQQAVVSAAHPCGPVCVEESSRRLSTSSILAISFAAGSALVLLLLLVWFFRWRKKNEFPFPKADETHIPIGDLTFMKLLGEGNFGSVCLARLEHEDSRCCRNKLVACKRIHDHPSRQERLQFLAEAQVFRIASAHPHPNVIQLVGLHMTSDPMVIVMDYMTNGDVKAWLRRATRHGDTVEQSLLLQFARDAARGMEHLTSLGIVHGDLAARNCLLDDTMVLKIADYGRAFTGPVNASGNLYSYKLACSNAIALPIRWMAPEAVVDGTQNEATDVWSFGVLLWEIFSLGQLPYAGLTNKEVLEEVVKGFRLSRPHCSPDHIYALMLSCWIPRRPTFRGISSYLQGVLPGQPLPNLPPLTQGLFAQSDSNGSGGGGGMGSYPTSLEDCSPAESALLRARYALLGPLAATTYMANCDTPAHTTLNPHNTHPTLNTHPSTPLDGPFERMRSSTPGDSAQGMSVMGAGTPRETFDASHNSTDSPLHYSLGSSSTAALLNSNSETRYPSLSGSTHPLLSHIYQQQMIDQSYQGRAMSESRELRHIFNASDDSGGGGGSGVALNVTGSNVDTPTRYMAAGPGVPCSPSHADYSRLDAILGSPHRGSGGSASRSPAVRLRQRGRSALMAPWDLVAGNWLTHSQGQQIAPPGDLARQGGLSYSPASMSGQPRSAPETVLETSLNDTPPYSYDPLSGGRWQQHVNTPPLPPTPPPSASVVAPPRISFASSLAYNEKLRPYSEETREIEQADGYREVSAYGTAQRSTALPYSISPLDVDNASVVSTLRYDPRVDIGHGRFDPTTHTPNSSSNTSAGSTTDIASYNNLQYSPGRSGVSKKSAPPTTADSESNSPLKWECEV